MKRLLCVLSIIMTSLPVLNAMQQEQATWHTVPFELQLNIWGGAENNNFCAKVALLNKFRLVCKSWHTSLRSTTNLKAFFEQLALKNFTELQCKAVIDFVSFVLSNQNTNPAERIFYKLLYKHFKIGINTVAQLVNDNFPLHAMAGKGADKAALCLLTLGVNKDAQDNGEETPLHRAAWNGHLEIAKLLLSQGANKDAQDKADCTPLHRAALNCHLEIVRLLLAQGANKEAQDNERWTPLHLAAENGHLEIVKLLLAQGANKETQDKYGRTPLHWAALHGHLEIVKLLLAQGANKEAQDRDRWTPLHAAALSGHLEIVKLLLSHNVNTASRTNINRTAADIAQSRFSRTGEEVYKQIFNLLKSS